jgi:hypothetical protein
MQLLELVLFQGTFIFPFWPALAVCYHHLVWQKKEHLDSGGPEI